VHNHLDKARLCISCARPLTRIFSSLAVAVPQNYLENGRLYHGFRKGVYMYPCDEVRAFPWNRSTIVAT